jgi:tellurite resistance protein TehA-like permease
MTDFLSFFFFFALLLRGCGGSVVLRAGWALTFPNVGWISTLRVLGDALQIPGFFAVHAVMAVLMCTVWAVLFGLTAIAFWKGKIFLADEADVLRDENRVVDNAV